MRRAQHGVSRLARVLSASAWLVAVAAITVTDQARPNPRGTALDGWFGVKRRNVWDDDLLGTALILTLMALLLSLIALATQSTERKRQDGTRYSVPLVFLAAISVVALGVFSSVLS